MHLRLIACVTCGIAALFSTAACVSAKNDAPPVVQIGNNLRLADQSVQINTFVKGQHTFVTGFIGEQGPLDFIVDTGSGANLIDSKIADAMGLQKVGETEVLSGGVEPLMLDIVVLPELRIDGLSIINAEFLKFDLDSFSGGEHQGIIGMKTFEDALLVFDPQNNAIEVSSGALSADDPGVLAYEITDQPIKRVMANVAGRDVSMHIDTGAPWDFTFPIQLSDTLPLQGPLQDGPPARLAGGQRSIKIGALEGVIKLGDLEFVNPQVMFIDPSAPHGNIGAGVLGSLVMTIDQKNSLISLRRSEAARSAPPVVAKTIEGAQTVVADDIGKPRRLGLQFRGMGGGPLTVSWVEPGSLGDQAGFKAGDVLATINGRPAQGNNMKELGELFRSTTPLRFEVERSGERRIIEIR